MFAVATSPVLRVGEVVTPVGPSARALAAALELGPGPAAITMLARVDPTCLDDVDRVRYLQAWEGCGRWLAARQSAAVVAVAGAAPADRDDFAREHVRLALLGCGGSPRACVDTARALAGPLRAAGAALGRVALSYDHARVLAQETRALDPRTAAQVSEQVLRRGLRTGPAGSESIRISPAELRRRVRSAVLRVDPLGAELAAVRAGAARQVAHRVEPDAQASLFVTGPAPDVATIRAALERRAARTGAADPRTLDQRRFDALVEICRRDGTGGPGATAGTTGTGATVHLYADAPTWAGLLDGPVELAGYGPIPAGLARDRFADARWQAVVTDALSGTVRAVSDRGYTPSARTRRHLRLTDRGCVFPGCGAGVAYCDADHSVPFGSGGCTDTDNCGLLCRRHHRLKTFTRWSWRRGPDGAVEWTDPLGLRWHTEPTRYLLPPPDPPDPPRSDTSLEKSDEERPPRVGEAPGLPLAAGADPPPF